MKDHWLAHASLAAESHDERRPTTHLMHLQEAARYSFPVHALHASGSGSFRTLRASQMSE